MKSSPPCLSFPPFTVAFPRTVDSLASSAGGPLPGGLGASLLLLLSELRPPLLPRRRHRRARQQRARQPAAAHLRRQGEESHCDRAQAGVHRGHSVPPPDLRRPPGQGTLLLSESSCCKCLN